MSCERIWNFISFSAILGRPKFQNQTLSIYLPDVICRRPLSYVQRSLCPEYPPSCILYTLHFSWVFATEVIATLGMLDVGYSARLLLPCFFWTVTKQPKFRVIKKHKSRSCMSATWSLHGQLKISNKFPKSTLIVFKKHRAFTKL